MKGTLFSADFVKDSSENLRLLELNTDTAFLTDALSDLDLSGWISVMSDNNITSVDIIYKPVIHRNILAKIKSILNTDATFITNIYEHPEDRNVIYPVTVDDASNKFILRLAYDESAIFDSTYAKNRLNVFNLFTSASGDGTNTYTSEYYHSSSDGTVYNTLTPSFNGDGLPDAVIKDVDQSFNPIDFFKIGSETSGESDQARWDAFIAENKADDKLIEKFNFHSSSLDGNKITSIRQFGIVYGSNLDWINILNYRVCAVFDHPTSLPEYTSSRYTNKLGDEHFYEYTTNFVKRSNRGLLGSHEVEYADGTFVEMQSASVGDKLASYYVSGSPMTENDAEVFSWGVSGSTFPSGSYLTSSDVVFSDTTKLKYGALIELDVNGDIVFAGSGKDFLVYNSQSNVMKFEPAVDLEADVHYFVNRSGDLVDIDEVNFYVTTDTDINVVELDVEDTDTIILSGSSAINSIVAHNAPCFVEGTQISLPDGSSKSIEDIKVGDEVLTYNFVAKVNEAKPVEAITSKVVSKTVEYTFDDGTTIEATLDHPLYCNVHGWVSSDPDYSKDKYDLDVKLISIGCEILKADGTVAKIVKIEIKNDEKVVYNLRQVKDNHNYYVYQRLAHNRGDPTCFVADTKITLSDGSYKFIQDIAVGDIVQSYVDGEIVHGNVTAVDHSHTVGDHAEACKVLGDDTSVYYFNDYDALKFTPEHPFLTKEGWKSLVPDPNQEPYASSGEASKLEVGDFIFNTKDNEWIEVEVINQVSTPADTPVYNFTVEEYHNYIAGNIVAHNK